MCRYTCCGCYWSNVHGVRDFEFIECGNYVLITPSSQRVCDGQFYCLKFKNIPCSLTSYLLYIEFNGEEYPIETRRGRQLTSADLYPCMLMSGIVCNDKYIVY